MSEIRNSRKESPMKKLTALLNEITKTYEQKLLAVMRIPNLNDFLLCELHCCNYRPLGCDLI